MLKLSPKQATRRKHFYRQGKTEATDCEMEWRDYLGDHAFDIHNQDRTFREIPGGPEFKTPQWERTVRR